MTPLITNEAGAYTAYPQRRSESPPPIAQASREYGSGSSADARYTNESPICTNPFASGNLGRYAIVAAITAQNIALIHTSLSLALDTRESRFLEFPFTFEVEF